MGRADSSGAPSTGHPGNTQNPLTPTKVSPLQATPDKWLGTVQECNLIEFTPCTMSALSLYRHEQTGGEQIFLCLLSDCLTRNGHWVKNGSSARFSLRNHVQATNSVSWNMKVNFERLMNMYFEWQNNSFSLKFVL